MNLVNYLQFQVILKDQNSVEELNLCEAQRQKKIEFTSLTAGTLSEVSLLGMVLASVLKNYYLSCCEFTQPSNSKARGRLIGQKK